MGQWRATYRAICAVGSATLAAGCSTLTPEQTQVFLEPIVTATTGEPAALRSIAQSGDARGQYVFSLVVGYGLNGEPADGLQAAEWRRKAVAKRGFRSISTYVPGIKGKPGRVVISNVPQYGYQPYEASLVDQCVAVLSAPSQTVSAQDLCGGQAAYARLKLLWDEAAPREH